MYSQLTLIFFTVCFHLAGEAAGGVLPGAPEAVDLTGEDDESDPSTVLEGGAVGRSEGINIKQEAQVCCEIAVRVLS